VTPRRWSDPELNALFGPDELLPDPTCDPEWQERDTHNLPDISDYQEER
jgi:hypothetical protein